MALRRLLTITRYTLLESSRNRVVWLLLLAFGAALGAASWLSAIAVTESSEIKSGVIGAGMRLFAVFLASLFVSTSMVKDFEEKRIYILLSLPMPRSLYYLGRLIGFSVFSLVMAALIGLFLLLYCEPVQVLIWTLSLACELVLVSAFSLLCVLTFQQIVVALSVVAGFYWLARSIAALQLIGHGPLIDLTELSQRFMVWFVDAVAFLLPDLSLFTQSEWLIYGGGRFALLLPILAQGVIYALLLVAASLFDLYRKNL